MYYYLLKIDIVKQNNKKCAGIPSNSMHKKYVLEG